MNSTDTEIKSSKSDTLEKNGYKRTKFGWIPEDWEVKKIGSVTTVSVGRDLKEKLYNKRKTPQYEYPVYSNTVDNCGLYGFYSTPEYESPSVTVVGRGVGLGTAFNRVEPFGAIGRLLILHPKEGVSSKFLTEVINNKVRFYKESTGVPQLTGIQIKTYSVPLPSHTEQKKIAKILSTWDHAIRTLEELITKKELLKKGLMQQLLNVHKYESEPNKRFPGFDKEWEEVKFKDVVKINRKSLNSETSPDYEFRYISLSDVEDGSINSPLDTYKFSEAPSRAKRVVSTGDILMATVRPRLQSFTVVRKEFDDAIVSTGFAVLAPKENFNIKYLYHYLFSHHMSSQFYAHTVGSNYPALNNSDVKKLKLWKPDSQREVNQIVSLFSTINDEIKLLREKKFLLEKQKKGLMQQLLTGRIRVQI